MYRAEELNKEWTEICQQIQTLQRRRVQIYKEAEDLNPGSIQLKIKGLLAFIMIWKEMILINI